MQPLHVPIRFFNQSINESKDIHICVASELEAQDDSVCDGFRYYYRMA